MRQDEQDYGDCADHQLHHHQLPGAHSAHVLPLLVVLETSCVSELFSHVRAECWLVITKIHCFVFNSIRLFFTVFLMCWIYAFKRTLPVHWMFGKYMQLFFEKIFFIQILNVIFFPQGFLSFAISCFSSLGWALVPRGPHSKTTQEQLSGNGTQPRKKSWNEGGCVTIYIYLWFWELV